jgi:hypothetical protein
VNLVNRETRGIGEQYGRWSYFGTALKGQFAP